MENKWKKINDERRTKGQKLLLPKPQLNKPIAMRN
jgi:hypothetical protein